jgi:hypothetical protein
MTAFLPPAARVCALLLMLVSGGMATAQESNVEGDQEIIFYPGIGYPVEQGRAWELEIRGCVCEPKRRAVELTVLRAALGLDGVKMDAAELALFKERTRLFLVDDKGGREVVVRIGGKNYPMKRTLPNGHFEGTARLTHEEMESLKPSGGRIECEAESRDARVFKGTITLLDPAGTLVISDIDDTIKITDVLKHGQMLRRTFLEPFEAVPGMAAAYQGWAKSPGTQFAYVSASPWQLYPPLQQFIQSNGFPDGNFFLKTFRAKDRSFASLFESPEKYKLDVIEPLIRQFPERRFVLVGDSGERDPEAYGALARKYPRQVTRIFIRNVTDEAPDGARFRKDFNGSPVSLWTVFKDPAEIEPGIRPIAGPGYEPVKNSQ